MDIALPNKIETTITDYDLECIPRAIYNDFISDLNLREEGVSGKSSGTGISHMIYCNDRRAAESLSFLSRVCPTNDYDEDVKVGKSNNSLNENADTRTVILTEWGIDILNFVYQETIPPLNKPKMTLPVPIHQMNKRAMYMPFSRTNRYGSVLNTFASIDPAVAKVCHNDCKEMNLAKVATEKKSTIRYRKKFIQPPKLANTRGLSFLGRGLLDVKGGWATVAEFAGDGFDGDITDHIVRDEISGRKSLKDGVKIQIDAEKIEVYNNPVTILIPQTAVIAAEVDTIYVDFQASIADAFGVMPISTRGVTIIDIEIPAAKEANTAISIQAAPIISVAVEEVKEQRVSIISIEEMRREGPSLHLRRVSSKMASLKIIVEPEVESSEDENEEDLKWLAAQREEIYGKRRVNEEPVITEGVKPIVLIIEPEIKVVEQKIDTSSRFDKLLNNFQSQEETPIIIDHTPIVELDVVPPHGNSRLERLLQLDSLPQATEQKVVADIAETSLPPIVPSLKTKPSLRKSVRIENELAEALRLASLVPNPKVEHVISPAITPGSIPVAANVVLPVEKAHPLTPERTPTIPVPILVSEAILTPVQAPVVIAHTESLKVISPVVQDKVTEGDKKEVVTSENEGVKSRAKNWGFNMKKSESSIKNTASSHSLLTESSELTEQKKKKENISSRFLNVMDKLNPTHKDSGETLKAVVKVAEVTKSKEAEVTIKSSVAEVPLIKRNSTLDKCKVNEIYSNTVKVEPITVSKPEKEEVILVSSEQKVVVKSVEVATRKIEEEVKFVEVEVVKKKVIKNRYLNAMDLVAINSSSTPSEIKAKNSQHIPILHAEPIVLVASAAIPQVVVIKEQEKEPDVSVASLPVLPIKEVVTLPQEISVETQLAAPIKIVWKDHDCLIKIVDFELHCFEVGKTKQYKPYLPINLRRILNVTTKAATSTIQCVIPRKGEKEGGEVKKISITFLDSESCLKWTNNLLDLTFGGVHSESMKRRILVLIEKSDKTAEKLVEKYMKEIFDVSKRPFEVLVVQYNEFSVNNLLEKQDIKTLGNIVCMNSDFALKIQQILVRSQHHSTPTGLICERDPVDAALDIIRSSVGKSKLASLFVTGLSLKREEGNKLIGLFKK